MLSPSLLENETVIALTAFFGMIPLNSRFISGSLSLFCIRTASADRKRPIIFLLNIGIFTSDIYRQEHAGISSKQNAEH
jgi:hypothetical protein